VRLLQAWAFNIAAIFVASAFIDGVDYADKFWVLLLAAFVFALVNMVLKPIVKALAFPLIIVSLGVALFFVNLFMLYITTWIVGPFDIATFWDAVWATIVIWAVNFSLQLVFGIEDRRRKRRR
jgi:putative membrane protein